VEVTPLPNSTIDTLVSLSRVIVGFRALERTVAERYVPSLVLAGGAPGSRSTVKLLENRPLVDNRPTAYVCRGYTCDKPVTDPDMLSDQLESAAKAGTITTA
jgi:uncharacterized protein YyaL (SSP411 family)